MCAESIFVFQIIDIPDTIIISESDVVLIASGIMSATLGLMLKQLQPDIKIEIYED